MAWKRRYIEPFSFLSSLELKKVTIDIVGREILTSLDILHDFANILGNDLMKMNISVIVASSLVSSALYGTVAEG